MATELDEISEAIGQLRAGQDGTNATLVRLEQKIEGGVAALRESVDRAIRDLRDRHHEHNNKILVLIGQIQQESRSTGERHDLRISSLEQTRAIQVGVTSANRRWTAVIAAVVSAFISVTAVLAQWYGHIVRPPHP